ncbi:hypothetical protein, partial [Pseudomonas aeruginosa]|uniref:hypothetical protein n=1 Tax=Pseudomonas aeruginosa TaxID=287 RepID=UPI003CC5346D
MQNLTLKNLTHKSLIFKIYKNTITKKHKKNKNTQKYNKNKHKQPNNNNTQTQPTYRSFPPTTITNYSTPNTTS